MKAKRYLVMMITMICFGLVNISHAATVTGTISYDGKVPKLKPVKMEADPICLSKHAGKIYPDVLVLGENNAMAYVFVYIKSGLPKKDFPVPEDPVVITQEGCIYSPHVVGVRTGQPVKILNPDGTLHNVHAIPKINKEFNIAMPKFRKEITKVFDKAEFMFPLKCDVHPWMGAWISVMDHPYFATSGKDGIYTIDDLPPGQYEIEAWHEKLGTKTMQLTVSGDEPQQLDFTFSRPSKKE